MSIATAIANIFALRPLTPELSTLSNEEIDSLLCDTCGDENPTDICPASERPCGHHCNHSWSHDECCWCGARWGES